MKGTEWLTTAVERTVLDDHDGRSGAALERVRLADGTRLVVKRMFSSADLTMRFSGDDVGRELVLWETGVLDRLPPGPRPRRALTGTQMPLRGKSREAVAFRPHR